MVRTVYIDVAVVERVESFEFLGVHTTNKLSWSKHTKKVVKRARQHLFPLRRLKRFGTGPQILKKLYSCTIESIETDCLTAWYGNCLISKLILLQRVVCTAQYITRAKLPAIQNLYTRQVIDCSLCYRTASGTEAPSQGPKGSLTDSNQVVTI